MLFCHVVFLILGVPLPKFKGAWEVIFVFPCETGRVLRRVSFDKNGVFEICPAAVHQLGDFGKKHYLLSIYNVCVCLISVSKICE